MSAPDQSVGPTSHTSVSEVIESLKQHEAMLAELIERKIRPAEAS